MIALIGVTNVSNKIAGFGTEQDLEESFGLVSLQCTATLNFTKIQTALSGLITLLRIFNSM